MTDFQIIKRSVNFLGTDFGEQMTNAKIIISTYILIDTVVLIIIRIPIKQRKSIMKY
jgi:hypothetical protein